MTDEEKKSMMEAMDQAASQAKIELEALPKEVSIPMAKWFAAHYAKAGHKRLGRVLVAFANANK